jgi:hypothetical protein
LALSFFPLSVSVRTFDLIGVDAVVNCTGAMITLMIGVTFAGLVYRMQGACLCLATPPPTSIDPFSSRSARVVCDFHVHLRLVFNVPSSSFLVLYDLSSMSSFELAPRSLDVSTVWSDSGRALIGRTG